MARLAESPTPYLKQEFGFEAPKEIKLQYRPNQVFALMRIGDPESGEVYRVIQRVCLECNLSVSRADENVGSEIILREIIKNLLESEFLIFDLSHERPNVYFELGYAFGVGNRAENVLLIAKEGTQIHFDIGLLRIHKYRSLDHLYEILSGHLKSMISAARTPKTAPERTADVAARAIPVEKPSTPAQALLAFLALPGVVALLVPVAWLWFSSRAVLVQPLGLVPLVVGFAVLLLCVRDFYVSGKGTLAPWAPPAHLVEVGFYRYSRNPMYVAVTLALVGWAAAFGSPGLFVYAIAVAVAFHFRVALGEEPWLSHTHGDKWVQYKSRVPRWLW
jgi:protein-S-isoprenylcysteine O-methyltransferase Ste14